MRDPKVASAAVVLYVVRMKAVVNGFHEKLLQTQAVIVARSLVGIEALPISIEDNEVLRHRVHELLKFPLRLLSILNVRARGEPADDSSCFVMQGLAADKKPAVLA